MDWRMIRGLALAAWLVLALVGAMSCGGANYVVSGEVIDAQGAPLADAWIVVAAHWVCCDGPADVGTLTRCEKTSPSGRFDLGLSRSTLFREDEVEYFDVSVAKVGYLELNTGLDSYGLQALTYQLEPCAGAGPEAGCVTRLADDDYRWCEDGDWQDWEE